MGADIRIDTSRAERWLKHKARELDKAMEGAMPGAGKIVERQTKASFLKGGYRNVRTKGKTWRIPTPPPRRDVVYRRTGHASRSIVTRAFKDGKSWNAAVGSPVKYVRALEEGATLRPTHPRNIVIGGTAAEPRWIRTSGGGKIHPRRMLAKARKAKKPDVQRFIQRRINKFVADAQRDAA